MFSLESRKNKKINPYSLTTTNRFFHFLSAIKQSSKPFFPFVRKKKQKASIACLDVREKNLIEKKDVEQFLGYLIYFRLQISASQSN